LSDGRLLLEERGCACRGRDRIPITQDFGWPTIEERGVTQILVAGKFITERLRSYTNEERVERHFEFER